MKALKLLVILIMITSFFVLVSADGPVETGAEVENLCFYSDGFGFSSNSACCQDGFDNDDDSCVDDSDVDCGGKETVDLTTCSDGVDEDCDGSRDCGDVDCFETTNCGQIDCTCTLFDKKYVLIKQVGDISKNNNWYKHTFLKNGNTACQELYGVDCTGIFVNTAGVDQELFDVNCNTQFSSYGTIFINIGWDPNPRLKAFCHEFECGNMEDEDADNKFDCADEDCEDQCPIIPPKLIFSDNTLKNIVCTEVQNTLSDKQCEGEYDVYQNEVGDITLLSIPNLDISSLEGLNYITDLVTVYADGNDLGFDNTYSSLSMLPNLEFVILSNNGIGTLGPFGMDGNLKIFELSR